MKFTPRHQFLVFLLSFFCLLGQSSAQSATGNAGGAPAPVSLFTAIPNKGLPSPDAAVMGQQVTRSRDVSIDFSLLTQASGDAGQRPVAAQVLTLNLFDDVTVTAVVQEVVNTPRGMSWTGQIEGVSKGQVVFVVSDGVFSANIALPNARYHVRYLQDGVYQVQQIDTSLFPVDHPSPPPGEALKPPAAAPDPRDLQDLQVPAVQPDTGATIDVMVVYSGAARASVGSVAAITSLIDLAITETNASYLNSGIVTRLRLVHAEEVTYTESAHASPDAFVGALNCITSTTDGCLDNVHALRNTYGADVVSFWIRDTTSCGLGWLSSSAATAFTVVTPSCATGNYSFGHEIGHNMGARHDIFVDTATTPLAYAHGLTNPTATNPWRTIMAYNDACAAVGKSCTRIQYWSNPAVNFGGVPMGNAAIADNHLVLNNSAFTVANFRASVTAPTLTVPDAPTIGVATGGNAQASVTFSAPANNGGTAITAYTATSSPGGLTSSGCTASPCTVTGLTNGTAYTFMVNATNSVGTGANSSPSNSVTPSATVPVSSPRLINLSTRGQVQAGDNVMIGGFLIGGTTAKTVLVRAVGPNLANFGVTGVLADPKLQVFSGQTLIATNDDWQTQSAGTTSTVAAIQATGLAPANPLESALLLSLSPGVPYTAVVSSAGSGTGVGIVEVFEIDHPEVPLVNLSTRGQVQTGSGVMIGGFIVQGTTPQTLLIRGVGPNLANYGVSGVLPNPSLTLYSGLTVIASNDDWGTANNAAAIQATNLAPVNPLEAALLVTLPPGVYTAVMSGTGGGTGVGIIEVFAQ